MLEKLGTQQLREIGVMTADPVLGHFQEQVTLCHAVGSTFTGELVARMAADLEAGGPVADLLSRWPGSARADAVAIRLCAALHAATLLGLDGALAAEYPAQQPSWDMRRVWRSARAFLDRERPWVAAFIEAAPQTNEVGRAIALLPGFLTLAREYDGPMDLIEIGASAGLNLNWDRFRYRTASWTWGSPSGVVVESGWSGPAPPIDVVPQIRSRVACDLAPPDLRDPAQRLRLRSYIWADQQQRLARFDAAADLAVTTGVRVVQAEASEWLAQRLAERAPNGMTVVYHSIFLQYPPREQRKASIAAIEAAGQRATADAPLAWLRFEPEVMLGGPRDSVRSVVDLVTWPGAVRRTLAFTDGHARSVVAADP